MNHDMQSTSGDTTATFPDDVAGLDDAAAPEFLALSDGARTSLHLAPVANGAALSVEREPGATPVRLLERAHVDSKPCRGLGREDAAHRAVAGRGRGDALQILDEAHLAPG